MTGDWWQPGEEFDFKALESIVGKKKRWKSNRKEESPELKNKPLRGLPKLRGHQTDRALEMALPPIPACPVTDLTVETHRAEGLMSEISRHHKEPSAAVSPAERSSTWPGTVLPRPKSEAGTGRSRLCREEQKSRFETRDNSWGKEPLSRNTFLPCKVWDLWK